jgi:hypothetical protein
MKIATTEDATKHTAGPWRAESERHPAVTDGNTWWRIYAGPDDRADLVANCDRTNRNPKPGIVIEVGRTADPTADDIQRDAANARLIAAAPDLLAALYRVNDMFRQMHEAGLFDDEIPSFMHPDEINGTVDAVRDAIAKATGK